MSRKIGSGSKRLFKWAFPGLCFFIFLFSGLQLSDKYVQYIADVGIRTAELRCRKRPLCQLHRNHGSGSKRLYMTKAVGQLRLNADLKQGLLPVLGQRDRDRRAHLRSVDDIFRIPIGWDRSRDRSHSDSDG